MEEIKNLEIALAFLKVASDARLCWHLFIYEIMRGNSIRTLLVMHAYQSKIDD
jgi:hypothetical protein